MDDDEDVDDHVPVLYDQRAYILVRNPAANGGGGAGVSAPPPAASPEGSKATTVASEDSKGSYVSTNGSASNGYVMGILKQRSHHNAEC